VTYLAGAALGGYIEKCGGDVQAALALIVRELRAEEDLAGLDEGGRTDDVPPRPVGRELADNLVEW
jgi:hypothetical protein